MFAFRVRYLRGSVTAADVRTGNEKSEVEWPPHPDRLFCALVQAWGDLGESEQDRRSLEWVEQLPPPVIRCGEALETRVTQRYVPVNDEWRPITKDSKPAQLVQGTMLGRIRQPRRIPSAPLDDDTVVFCWPDANPAPDTRASLSGLARAVSNLGHPSCLVAVDVLDQTAPLAPTWVPRADGNETLRVPAPGRLAELTRAYKASLRRRGPLGEWTTYGPPAPELRTSQGYHRDLIVFRLEGERSPLPLEIASRIIGVWRKALIERADQPVSEVISGHAPDSTPEAPKPSQKAHLALVPLADVGHRYARGHLLGLAAVLPGRLPREQRRVCLSALGRVGSLTLGPLGVWQLERCNAEEERRGLRPETWLRPARIWASVTPVVFGRYPRDLWGMEAAEMICEACGIAGLPQPSEVATAPVAWILGAPPSYRFMPLPSRPGKPQRAHTHVRLVFDEPVAGPVLVGAGRH